MSTLIHTFKAITREPLKQYSTEKQNEWSLTEGSRVREVFAMRELTVCHQVRRALVKRALVPQI